MQTIDEEAESSALEIKNKGPFCSAWETTLTHIKVCAEAEVIVSNKPVHSFVNYDVVHLIEEEQTGIDINQGISFISDVVSSINDEVRPINLEEGKTKANPYLHANKPIKCKRSKSLCVRGDSLIKLE